MNAERTTDRVSLPDAPVGAPRNGFEALGEALVRIVARSGIKRGKPLDDGELLRIRRFMRALTTAFDRAESAGSVCIRLGDAAAALAEMDGTANPESGTPSFEEAPNAAEAAFEKSDDERFLAKAADRYRSIVEQGLDLFRAVRLAGGMSELIAFCSGSRMRRPPAEPFPELPPLDAAMRPPEPEALPPFTIDWPAEDPLLNEDFAAIRLYITRNAFEELSLADRLVGFARMPAKRLKTKQAELIDRLARATGADRCQEAALALAARRNFAVICGGPGTGKTTTVVQILECLLSENPDLRIMLAAPTGKAASRMRQSILRSIQNPAFRKILKNMAERIEADEDKPFEERQIREGTIHRWLAANAASGERPSADNPLPADVLVIDEASMIDIHLAARLFRAVSPKTRLIILGDKHQLAAVGPGAVFADISDSAGPLKENVVMLEKSRRFEEGTVIAKLAAAINQAGEAAPAKQARFADPHSDGAAFERVKAILAEEQSGKFRACWRDEPVDAATGLSAGARAWLDDKIERYLSKLIPYLKTVQAGTSEDVKAELWNALWLALDSFRPLAAQRRGAQSVDAVNAYFESAVRDALLENHCSDETADLENYPGRVVIVRRNDGMLGVFNGDVGIVVPEVKGIGRDAVRIHTVVFGDSGKRIPAALMPAHDTAFAMTIHQSQGSEFEDVAVFLPINPHSGLATRELLYTGVTRTKGTVTIFGSAESLKHAVETPAKRAGGLYERLRELMRSKRSPSA